MSTERLSMWALETAATLAPVERTTMFTDFNRFGAGGGLSLLDGIPFRAQAIPLEQLEQSGSPYTGAAVWSSDQPGASWREVRVYVRRPVTAFRTEPTAPLQPVPEGKIAEEEKYVAFIQRDKTDDAAGFLDEHAATYVGQARPDAAQLMEYECYHADLLTGDELRTLHRLVAEASEQPL